MASPEIWGLLNCLYSVMAGISIGSAGSGNPICKRDGGSSTCSVREVLHVSSLVSCGY